MSPRTYCVLSSVVFTVVAGGHLLRASRSVPVMVGAWQLPIAASWAAAVIGAALAAWGFRLAASLTSPA
jgi:hypothetical protein